MIMKTFEQIEQLGEGSHKCGCFFSGWIEISKIENGYDVYWGSGKETHNPLYYGSMLAASFYPNKIDKIYRSHITMWPVYDEATKKHVVSRLRTRIEMAYKYRQSRI